MGFVKQKLNTLKNNNFLKGVAVLSGGTAVAQIVLPFFFMPLIGRLYGPEPQGIYGKMCIRDRQSSTHADDVHKFQLLCEAKFLHAQK